MKLLVAPPKPPPAVPSPPKPEITLETLPKECRIVLEAAAPAAPATAPVRAAAGRK